MNRARATALAIKALEEQIQQLAIDANLHDTYSYVIPRTITASKERQKLRAAIEALREPKQERMQEL